MRFILACVVLMALLPLEVYSQPHNGPYHDCCDKDCPGASHTPEQLSGGCNLDPEHNWWCYHQYGPSSWVATDNDIYGCDGMGFLGAIACGEIVCPNGTGGWKIKGVSITGCPGKLQATSAGIDCFNDTDDDGVLDPGESIFQHAGC